MIRKRFGKQILAAAAAMILSAAGVMTAWAYTKLDTINDLYWDENNGTVACWEEVEDADQYEVSLYCNESRVTSVTLKKDRYNFEKKMTKEGEYTFRVRAITKDRDYRNSDWSDYSDGIYISADYAELLKNGGKIDTVHSGPGALPNDQSNQAGSGVVYTPQWIPEENQWRYRNADGSYQANGWWMDPDSSLWYYFDANGYMMTGWIEVNGLRYYLQPSGAMVTGQQTIDGVVYQFNESGALTVS